MRRRAAPSRLSSSSPHTAAKIRDRPPTHGLSRAGWRACGPGSTCGSRSVSSTRPTWSTCSTAVEEQLWSPRCCWPMPTMLASTSLPRSPAAALVTGYARPVCWVRTFGWCQRCMSASPSWGFAVRPHTGVVVLAIGSSHPAANARTSTVASRLAEGTQWAAVTTAFITRPEASLADATDRLRRHGARRMVIAPWLLAPGILSDRVRGYAREAGIAMAQPLGAHPMVAATMWDRYRQAVAGRIAA